MSIEALQLVYRTFNRELFNNELSTVGFVSEHNKKHVFRYVHESNVISIGRNFSEVNSRELMDEMLHEMVHICNAESGVIDHTPNQYHKKEFCDAALSVGLCVLHTSNRGWGITTSTVSPQFEGSYRGPEPKVAKAREAAYRVARIHPMTLAKFQREIADIVANKPTKQYQFKYVCRCPSETGNSVRSGRRPDGPHPLSATCNICKAKFVFEGELPETSGKK